MISKRSGLVMGLFLSAALTYPAFAGSTQTDAKSIEGTWLGTLKVPPAELRIVFNIKANADGLLTATMDSPDQGASGIAISRITVENGRLRLESSAIQGRYEGTLDKNASVIDGKWTQAGSSFPLVMKRVQEAPKVNRPQAPKKPYPYVEEEVTYRNTEDTVTLAGTLTLPRTGGPFPAVILIGGSGAQDRDETVFGHRPFLVLADFLTRQGIAVLRTDDRGVGGSTGSMVQATSENFAKDVLAGLAYLKTRREIDPKRIGLVGHSEGGLIAPMVAVRSRDVSFVILMAGTGLTGEQVIEGQIVRLLKAGGAEQPRIDSALQSQRQICDIVKREADAQVVRQKVREVIAAAVSKLDEKDKQAVGRSDAYIDSQVKAATSPWFRFFISYDPRTTLRKVKCPVLAINGELDIQVWADDNLPAIEQALKEGGNMHVTVTKLPGLNHLFQKASTGAIAEYAQIEETVSPLALETIAGWIQK